MQTTFPITGTDLKKRLDQSKVLKCRLTSLLLLFRTKYGLKIGEALIPTAVKEVLFKGIAQYAIPKKEPHSRKQEEIPWIGIWTSL